MNPQSYDPKAIPLPPPGMISIEDCEPQTIDQAGSGEQPGCPLSLSDMSLSDMSLSDMSLSDMSPSKIYQRLNTTPQQIAAFCEKWNIHELSLFGSVLRDDFRQDGEQPSDIDLLYIPAPGVRYGFDLFDMKEELETLLGRSVDLVSEKGIQNSRNWLRRKSILDSKQVIYVQRSAVSS
ncbi:MAG: hypothetical protein OHK0035_31340 [Cyanobacteria bacterium J069]